MNVASLNKFDQRLSSMIAMTCMIIMLCLTVIGNTVQAEEAGSTDISGDIPEAHRLSLKDMKGNDHTLHDYAIKDKWLVVMVWQSDCHVCNQEAEGYDAWYKKNKSGASTLIGMSTDGWENKEAAQGFLDEHKVTFPSTLISFEELNKYYQDFTGQSFFGTPSFLIYSPTGELKAAQTGAVPTDLIDNYIRDNSQQASL